MRLSWSIDKITKLIIIPWPTFTLCHSLIKENLTGYLQQDIPEKCSFWKRIDWAWGRDYRSSALKCWWMHIQNLPKSQIYLFSKCQFDCNPISNSIAGNFSPYIFATIEPHFPHLDCLIYSNKKYYQTFSFSCCALQFRPPEIGKHRHQVSLELPGHLSWKINIGVTIAQQIYISTYFLHQVWRDLPLIKGISEADSSILQAQTQQEIILCSPAHHGHGLGLSIRGVNTF